MIDIFPFFSFRYYPASPMEIDNFGYDTSNYSKLQSPIFHTRSIPLILNSLDGVVATLRNPLAGLGVAVKKIAETAKKGTK
ncbi:MAG TPA: hypothetical protein DCX54_02315 [Flavobacteriales bacterium]|nr:hypothetical protein [Flavobacteriales bacterium]